MVDNKKVKMVMYTDGGFKNQIMSGGVHAYTYEITDKTKPVRFTGWTITDSGYVSKEKPIPHSKNVTPLTYYDMSMDLGEGNSFFAETMAIVMGITNVIIESEKVGEKITDILVRTDSESNIAVMNNALRSNFKDNEVGTVVKKFMDMILEHEITLNFKHVRAHNSEIGNEIVDTYATIGSGLDNEVIYVSNARRYWIKTGDRNPFINGRKLIYNTNSNRKKGEYRIVNVKDSSFVGRVDPEGLGYSLYSGEPDDYIEDMITWLDEMTDEVSELATINLASLYNGFNFKFLSMFGKSAFEIDKKHKRIYIKSSEIVPVITQAGDDTLDENINDIMILSHVASPKGLAMEAENQFEIVDLVLESYKKKNGPVKFVDITRLIYRDVLKVPQGSKDIYYKHLPKDKYEFKAKIKLKFGVNLPTVAQLNKQTKKNLFKVSLGMIWQKDVVTFAIVTDMGNGHLVTTDSSSAFYR